MIDSIMAPTKSSVRLKKAREPAPLTLGNIVYGWKPHAHSRFFGGVDRSCRSTFLFFLQHLPKNIAF